MFNKCLLVLPVLKFNNKTIRLNSSIVGIHSSALIFPTYKTLGKISHLLIKDLYSDKMAENCNNELSSVLKITWSGYKNKDFQALLDL